MIDTSTNLYCATCHKHTQHVHVVSAYTTRCTVCNGQTSQLMRAQAESHTYTAPDGTKSVVVEHTPGKVVFYVPSGEYAGYYEYDKHRNIKEIKKLET